MQRCFTLPTVLPATREIPAKPLSNFWNCLRLPLFCRVFGHHGGMAIRPPGGALIRLYVLFLDYASAAYRYRGIKSPSKSPRKLSRLSGDRVAVSWPSQTDKQPDRRANCMNYGQKTKNQMC